MQKQLQEQYASETECKRAIAEYNKDKKPEEELRYCSYLNSITGKRMYVPCTIEYFYAWRNMLSEERRKEREAKACRIQSGRYKNTFKVCRYYGKDCECKENCPYINKKRYAANGMTYLPGQEVVKGGCLSIEQAFEDYELEPAEQDNLFYQDNSDPLVERLHELIDGLAPEDKKLISLYLENKTDKEIAAILNKPKSTVTSRRERLIQILKNNSKK